MPDVELLETTRLRFAAGDEVRAASAVARLGGGWLIAQDDAVHAAWWRPRDRRVDRIRLLPPRDGHETFDEASGTKGLKPDIEAACEVTTSSGPAVLLLGSGSLPPRTIGALVRNTSDGPASVHADLAPLYEDVRRTLGLGDAELNLEGACVVGERLRWFQRGIPRAGVVSASVDLDVSALVAAIEGRTGPDVVATGTVRRYPLADRGELPLAITDAVTLPDDRVCVSVTAEDTPDAVADGPILGSALALLGEDGEDDVIVSLPAALADRKIEGLAVVDARPGRATLLAVADEDDPDVASFAAFVVLRWP